MVRYPFRCEDCQIDKDLEFHVIQRKLDPPHCPNCGKPMKRVFTPPAIRFVGSGFHVNDYPK